MINEFIIRESLPERVWVTLGPRLFTVSICRGWDFGESPYGLACEAIGEGLTGNRVHMVGSQVFVYTLGQIGVSVAGGNIEFGDYVVPDKNGYSHSVGRTPHNKFVAGICSDEAVKSGDHFRVIVWPQWIGERP